MLWKGLRDLCFARQASLLQILQRQSCLLGYRETQLVVE